ncbi:DUF4347 domain-containing protein [Lentisphaerota bacterium WC36G]|nr:DUF4347 domain-containing protein [Lentisphaerae bacterium WC36]
MYQLEDRILFDAAAAVDVAEANENSDANFADDVPTNEDQSGHTDSQLDQNYETLEGDDQGDNTDDLLIDLSAQIDEGTVKNLNVLLIDDDIDNADEIAELAGENTLVIKYDASQVSGDELINLIKDNVGENTIDSIGFITEESNNGTLQVISETTTSDNIDSQSQSDFWNGLDSLINDNGDINFFTPNLAGSEAGVQLLDKLADNTDADVNASTDYTGGKDRNADWVLEYTENGEEVDLKDVYFADSDLLDDITIETSEQRELYVINGILPDKETIIDGLPADAEYVIMTGENGLESLLSSLEGRGEYDAIHLITNGGKGYFRMGYDAVDGDYVAQNQDSFAELGDSITEDGDILVYGCELTAVDEGVSLVNYLADVTGADIAASDDITGHGGDWELEYSVGVVETDVLSFNDYNYHLAGIVVNVFDDYKIDANDERISLREAIYYAEDGDLIEFVAYTAFLDLETTPSAKYLTFELTEGELVIDKSITIDGTIVMPAGPDLPAIIDGMDQNRIFLIQGENNEPINVELKHLQLVNGHAKANNDIDASGGGIYIGSEVDITIHAVDILNCYAEANGGGIFNSGNLIFEVGSLSGHWYGDVEENTANNGGGIYNRGTLDLRGEWGVYNVNIEGNDANVNGGGVYNSGMLISNAVDISYNNAGILIDEGANELVPGSGGGLYSNGIIDRFHFSIVNSNFASGDGGGIFITGAENDTHLVGLLMDDNVAQNGGGVAFVDSKAGLRISHAYMDDNYACVNGGSIYYVGNYGGLRIDSDDFFAENYKYEVQEPEESEEGEEQTQISHYYKILSQSSSYITDSRAGNEGAIIYMDRGDLGEQYVDFTLTIDSVMMSADISSLNDDSHAPTEENQADEDNAAIFLKNVDNVTFNKVNLTQQSYESDGMGYDYERNEYGMKLYLVEDDVLNFDDEDELEIVNNATASGKVLTPTVQGLEDAGISGMTQDIIDSLGIKFGDSVFEFSDKNPITGQTIIGVHRGYGGFELYYKDTGERVVYTSKTQDDVTTHYWGVYATTDDPAADPKYSAGDIIFDFGAGEIGVCEPDSFIVVEYGADGLETGINYGLKGHFEQSKIDVVHFTDHLQDGVVASFYSGTSNTFSISNSSIIGFTDSIVIEDPDHDASTLANGTQITGVKLNILSSTFSSGNETSLRGDIVYGSGTMTVKDSTFYNSGIELLGSDTKKVTVSNSAFVGKNDNVVQFNIENIDSTSLNISSSMISHYYNTNNLDNYLSTNNLQEITVGTSEGKSLLTEDPSSTMTSISGVLDSKKNLLGVDEDNAKFLSTFSFLDDTLRFQGDHLTETHAVMYEQSLLFGYYVGNSYRRAGSSSSSTDQRGANRHGYHFDSNGKLVQNSGSSIGSFEAIFYTSVTSKGDDMFVMDHYNYDTNNYNMLYYDKAKSVYKGFDDYSHSQQSSMLYKDSNAAALIGDGSSGMTLREAEYWIDHFDREASQSVALNGVKFKDANGNIQTGATINLYDHNRYVHFDKNVFSTTDGEENTITLAAQIDTGWAANSYASDKRYNDEKSVMIGTAFNSAIAFDEGAMFLSKDHNGDPTALIYSDKMAQDFTYMSQDNENRINVVNDSGRVFVNEGDSKSKDNDGNIINYGGGNTLILNNIDIDGYLEVKNMSSQTHGAGIMNEGTMVLNNVVVKDSDIIFNDVEEGLYRNHALGGGIYNSGEMAIYDSTITSNELYVTGKPKHHSSIYSGMGAGIYNSGTLILENSAVLDNSIEITSKKSVSDSGYGAGIYSKGESIAVVNSTISGNFIDLTCGTEPCSMGWGSAIHLADNDEYDKNNVLLVNNTIVNNRVESKVSNNQDEIIPEQAGIYVASDPNLVFRMSNCIVANNVAVAHAHFIDTIAIDFFINGTTVEDVAIFDVVDENNGNKNTNLVGAYYYNAATSDRGKGYDFNTANIDTTIDFDVQDPIYWENKTDFHVVDGVSGGLIKNLNLSEEMDYNGGKTLSYRLMDGSIAFSLGSREDALGAVTLFNQDADLSIHSMPLQIRSISANQSIDQRGLYRDYDSSAWNIGSYESLMLVTVTSNSSGVFNNNTGFVYNDSKYLDVGTALGYFDSDGNWIQQHMTIEEALYWVDGAAPSQIFIETETGNYRLNLDTDDGYIYFVDDSDPLNEIAYYLCGEYVESNTVGDSFTIGGFVQAEDCDGDIGEAQRLVTKNGEIVVYNLDNTGNIINDQTSEGVDFFYEILDDGDMNFSINYGGEDHDVLIDEQGQFYAEIGGITYYLYAEIDDAGDVTRCAFRTFSDGQAPSKSILVDDPGDPDEGVTLNLLTLNMKEDDKNRDMVSAGGEAYLYDFYESAKNLTTIQFWDKEWDENLNVLNQEEGNGTNLTIVHSNETGFHEVTFNPSGNISYTYDGEVYALYGVYNDVFEREDGYRFYAESDTEKPLLFQYNKVDFDANAEGQVTSEFTYAKSLHDDFHQVVADLEKVTYVQPEDISIVSFDASHTVITGTSSNPKVEELWVTDRSSKKPDECIYFNNSKTNDSLITFTGIGALEVTKDVTIDGEIKCDENPTVNSHLAGKRLMLDAEEKSRIFIVDNKNVDKTSTAYIKNIDMVNSVAEYFEIIDGKKVETPVHGGAIFSREHLDLANVSITESHASGHGGAIYNETGNVVLDNVKIENVSALYDGGAIYAATGNFDMRNSDIAKATAGGSGGAMFLDSQTDVYIENSGFAYNEAGKDGGGLYITGPDTLLINTTTIANNEAGEYGGGLYISGVGSLPNTETLDQGTPSTDDDVTYQYGHLNYVTIANNVAGINSYGDKIQYKGGGIYLETGTLYVNNSIVSQNSISSYSEKGIFSSNNAYGATGSNLECVDGQRNNIVRSDALLSKYAEKTDGGSFKVYVLSGSAAENAADNMSIVDKYGNIGVDDTGQVIADFRDYRSNWTTAGAYEKESKTYIYVGSDKDGNAGEYTGANDIFENGYWYEEGTSIDDQVDSSKLLNNWDITFVIDGQATLKDGATLEVNEKNSLVIDDDATAAIGHLIVKDATVESILSVNADGILEFAGGALYTIPVVNNPYAPGGEYSITDRINNKGTIIFSDDRYATDSSKRFATIDSMIALDAGSTIVFHTDTIKGDFSVTVNDLSDTTVVYDYDSTRYGKKINTYGIDKYYNLQVSGIGNKTFYNNVEVLNRLTIGQPDGVTTYGYTLSEDTGKVTFNKQLKVDNFSINDTEVTVKKDFVSYTTENSEIVSSSITANNFEIYNDATINLEDASLKAKYNVEVDGAGNMTALSGVNRIDANYIDFDNELNVIGGSTSLTFDAKNIMFAENSVNVAQGGTLSFDIDSSLKLIESATPSVTPASNLFNLGMFSVEERAGDGSYEESSVNFNSIKGNVDFADVNGAEDVKGELGIGGNNITIDNMLNLTHATLAFNSDVYIDGDLSVNNGIVFNADVVFAANGNYTIESANNKVEFNGNIIGNNSILTIEALNSIVMNDASNLAMLTMLNATNIFLTGNTTVNGNISIKPGDKVVVDNAKITSKNGSIQVEAAKITGNSVEFVEATSQTGAEIIDVTDIELTGNLVNKARIDAENITIEGDFVNGGTIDVSTNFTIGTSTGTSKITQIGDMQGSIQLLTLNGNVELVDGDFEVASLDFGADSKMFSIDKGASLYVNGEDQVFNASSQRYFNLADGGTLYLSTSGADDDTIFYVGDDSRSVRLDVTNNSTTNIDKLGIQVDAVKTSNRKIKDMDSTVGLQFKLVTEDENYSAEQIDLYYHSGNVSADYDSSDSAYMAYNTDGKNWITPEYNEDGTLVDPNDELTVDKTVLMMGTPNFNRSVSLTNSITTDMTFTFTLADVDFTPTAGEGIFTGTDLRDVYLNANQQFWMNQELVNSTTYRVRYNDMAYQANTKAFLAALKNEGLADSLGGTPESGLSQASLLANDNGIIFENNSEEFYGAMDGTYAVGFDAYQSTPDLVGDFASGVYTNYGESEVKGALESIMVEMAEEKDLFDTHPAVNTGPDSVISWFQRQIRETL